MTRHNPLVFTDPVYGVNYIVAYRVGKTVRSQNKILAFCEETWGIKLKDPDKWRMLPDNLACCVYTGKRVLIQFGKGVRLREAVHECSHAAVAIFDYLQIPVNEKNDEAFAYYIAYLVDKVWGEQ